MPQITETRWNPEAKEAANYNPVLFSVELTPEEEEWTLDQLMAKYPKPEPKA